MSRIDDLIAELCPDGDEVQPLGKIFDMKAGNIKEKDVNGKKFPMEWYMLNLNNGGKTFNEVVNVSFDKTFRESFFEIQDFKKNYTGGN